MVQSSFDATAAAAVDALYAVYGLPAVYTPNGGSAVSITLLRDDDARDNVDRFASRGTTKTLTGSVRVSEVAALGRGDTLQITGESVVYRITPQQITTDGIEWDFQAIADETIQLGDVQVFPDR